MAKIFDSVWIKIAYVIDATGIRDMDVSLDKMGSRLGGVAAGLTTVATLFAGLGAAAYSAGAASEQAFVRLQTQIGLSAEETARAREELRSYSRETGTPLATLGEAFFSLRSAGLDEATSQKITEIAAKGATAQYGTAGAVARLLSRAATLYPDLDPEKAADQFAASIQFGDIANAAELTSAVPRILPIAESLGVSFGETLSALSSLTLVLPNATEAVTGLRGILTEFLNPTAQAREIFEQFGITADQVRAILDEKGIIGAVQWLWEALGQDQEMMGKVIERTEGLNAALTLVGPQAERFRQIEIGVAEASGNLEKAFKIQAETGVTQLSIMMNKLSLALEAVWVKMGPLIDAFSKLPDEVILATAALAALQAVLIVFSMGAGGWGMMIAGVKGLAAAFRISTYATIANKIAMVANFIVQRLLIGGTWALTKAIYGAITATVRFTWSLIVNTFALVRNIIVGTVHTAALVISKIATWAVTAAQWAWNIALAFGRGVLWASVLGAIAMAKGISFAAIAMLVAKGAVWLLNAALYAMPIIGWIGLIVAAGIALYVFRDQIMAFVRNVLGWLRSNWPLLLWVFMGPFAIIYRVLWGYREQFVAVFKSIWDGVVHWFGKIADFIGGVFDWIGDRFAQVFGPIRGLFNAAGRLLGGIGSLGNLWVDTSTGVNPSGRPTFGGVPVGASSAVPATVQSSVRVDNINVNLEHGDSAEIAANVGSAISDEAKNISKVLASGNPHR